MPTNAKQVVQSFTLPVHATPERVFPLLCPVREYDWIDGWDCRLVHSKSGLVEEGCIFVTEHAPEGHTIWVTARHDPAARRLEFVRVTPESHVSRMALAVAPDGPHGSTLEIGWTFTALAPRGETLLAHLEDGRALGERSARLGRALDHYLRTGSMLKPDRGGAHG
jgi:hypothetical protein